MNNSLQKLKAVACPICRKPDAVFYAEKERFKFFRSKSCGLVFLFPMPDTPPASVYGEDYFSGATKGFGYVDYDHDKSAMVPLFKRFLSLMAKHLPRRGRLLDVGAATGYFIDLANKNGWSAQGIDISAHAANEARRRGLLVEAATLESFRAADSAFAAVTMWDVLEHLPDPAAAVQKIHALLQPGGLLAINTPDSSSLWARLWRGKWQALVPPEHMILFTKRSLEILLGEAGYEILESANPIKKFNPGYILNILSRTVKIPGSAKLIEILNKKPWSGLAIPIPARDNIFVLARKK